MNNGYSMACFVNEWGYDKEVEPSIRIVHGFGSIPEATYKQFPHYKKVADVSSEDTVLVAITRSSHQEPAEKELETHGYAKVLRFSGNGGSDLKLWIKGRIGDDHALVAPPLPTSSVEKVTQSVFSASAVYGFHSCCGAYVRFLNSRRAKRSERKFDTKTGSGLPGVLQVTQLEVASVRCDDDKLLEIIYAGHYVPIYRYSTKTGEQRYILAKQPTHYNGASFVGGKSLTEVYDVFAASLIKA